MPSANAIKRRANAQPPASVMQASRNQVAARRSEAQLFFGRHIDIPFNGWAGYAGSTAHLTGTVMNYTFTRHGYRFSVDFPAATNTDPIGLTWAQLRGEQPWHLSPPTAIPLLHAPSPILQQRCMSGRQVCRRNQVTTARWACAPRCLGHVARSLGDVRGRAHCSALKDAAQPVAQPPTAERRAASGAVACTHMSAMRAPPQTREEAGAKPRKEKPQK